MTMNLGLTFNILVDFVCCKWSFLDVRDVRFVFSLPGHSQCLIDNDEDLRNMLFIASNISLSYIDIFVKQISCPDVSNFKGSGSVDTGSISAIVERISDNTEQEVSDADFVSAFGSIGDLGLRFLNNVHICGSAIRTSKNVPMSSGIVADIIGNRVSNAPLLRPIDVIKEIKSDYGLDISYHKACCLDMEFDETSGCFKRCFVAFDLTIFGFNFCRPILFLDGTFLKSSYKGNLLSATSKDGEQGLFVVAFVVVVAEDEDNWTWFLRLLRKIVDVSRRITFISDRNYGLLQGVRNIFPATTHAYCLNHLNRTLKDKLKGHHASFREMIVKKFKQCVYVLSKIAFHDRLQELLSMGGDRVASFIDEAPACNWANVYFMGKRYSEMSSNAAESFNSQIFEFRSLPITNMIDMIRLKLMNQMSFRREDSYTWTTFLCPSMEKKIQESKKLMNQMYFEVHSSPREVVNIAR
ncbi:uncharacterized protein LOC119979862 [Tripterygium wilfordii]|uniref:uncharacterized protein LOC119979862 n=1 Tax=Tripterygium wilfordii TaxID=458696 RepID=UPI0018F84AA0|nr:uncharacterized protein LOC119979862 [Tripterygium wilfordii]